MVSKHVLCGYCYVVPQYSVYYVIVNIFCAAKNNIGVVIALWAPIILVWFNLFPVPIVFFFSAQHGVDHSQKVCLKYQFLSQKNMV